MACPQGCTHTLSTLILMVLFMSPCATCMLVPATPLNLEYHRGPLLAGEGPIKLHLTFYGDFTSLEKGAIKSFLNSLSDTPYYSDEIFSRVAQKSVRLSFKTASRFSTTTHELKPLAVVTRQEKPFARSGSSSESVARNGFSSQFLRGASRLLLSSVLHSASSSPTVAQWWSLTQAYTDLHGNRVSPSLLIEHEATDTYSLGKILSLRDLASLAKTSARRAAEAASRTSNPPAHNLSIHIIFTAADVVVEGFCMHTCGHHAHTDSDGDLDKVVYAWVGNARHQCPGYCEWPFVRTEYGPEMDPLRAPNSASADGMIINLAKVLTEAATDPFGDGYYLGGGSHVGVGGVCTGAFGNGAFPGYPGLTLEDPLTGASFNVMGLHHSKYLLPYIWNPQTLSCAVHP